MHEKGDMHWKKGWIDGEYKNTNIAWLGVEENTREADITFFLWSVCSTKDIQTVCVCVCVTKEIHCDNVCVGVCVKSIKVLLKEIQTLQCVCLCR